jgi:hypothetical protein
MSQRKRMILDQRRGNGENSALVELTCRQNLLNRGDKLTLKQEGETMHLFAFFFPIFGFGFSFIFFLQLSPSPAAREMRSQLWC